MHIQESRKIQGDLTAVWQRASAIDEIPRYWHGTRSLAVVRREGGVVTARIKFAFGGSGEAEISADDARRTLTIDYKHGPFTGKQTVVVGDDSVTATWDVNFRGVFRMASKWNEGHFRSGTVHALERLVAGG